MSDTPQKTRNSGWHAPLGTSYVDRQRWYRPTFALTDEQLKAIVENTKLEQQQRASLATELIISSNPNVLGGWYAPEGHIPVEPARDLGDILPQIGAIPPTAVAALTDEQREALSVQIDSEELAFRQSPHVLGEVQPYREAPELPLSANLERGMGGLRDEKRDQEAAATMSESASAVEEDDDLTFEEIAQMRESSNITVDVPPRGYGGISDVGRQEPAIEQQDTGNIQVPNITTSEPARADAPIAPALTGPVQTPQFAQTDESMMNQVNDDSQPMSTPQPPQPQNQSAQRFREVEQSVKILRQQFANAQITRAQLEAELRRLMVLDEQGRWWTLGVDSNRWYRYDGREWVPDTPPQTGAQPAVSSAALNVPTETGIQPAIGTEPPAPKQSSSPPQVAIDEYGMPLPQRVTIDDPGATAVNLNAVTAGLDEVTIEKPGPRPAPVSATAGISPEQAAQAGASIVPKPPSSASQPITAEEAEPEAEKRAPATTKLDKYGQPDYSAALGSQFSRSTFLRMAMWSSLIGSAAILGVIFCVLLFFVGYYFNTVNAYSDEIKNLSERTSKFETVYVYAEQDDGTDIELARFNDQQRGARTEVALEDISPWAIHALISTEDETFYSNPGFSIWAIGRAIYTNLTSSGPTSGASTITQQLARRLLLDEDFAAELSAERKITEIILANQLSLQYDKNEILELYFNEMSFGGFTVGIEAASQVYFNKSASELNVFEAAFLVGLVQSPATYDPFRNREAALGRMETVLNLMVNNTGCVQMQHQTNVPGFDLSQPLCVTREYLEVEVPHLKAIIQTQPFTFSGAERRYDHFTLWAWDEVNQMFSQEEIFNNGFRIYTTVDPDIQETAQRAVADQVARYAGVNNGSVVVIDPQTGAVLAMVGSADFDNLEIDGEVNVALTPQQPGSSIKPIVYLAALEGLPEQGEYWTASTVIWDVPSAWGDYIPVNYDGRFRGPVTVRYALGNSLNIPAVKAMAFVQPQRFEAVANRMGIEFPLQSPVEAGLPAALGAAEVYLFDMVAAYSAFANTGYYYEPYGIRRIEDKDGNIIFDVLANAPSAPVRTVSEQHAYIISDILSDQEARSDTFGAILNIPGYPNVAVKTGTSNGPRDLLTIGWTPQVIVGVWMGNTDNSVIFPNTLSGSQVAGPVWIQVMQAALNGLPSVDFPPPPGIVESVNQVCRDSGALAPATGCGPGGVIPREIYVGAGVLEDWPEGQLPLPPEKHTFRTIQVDKFTDLLVNQYCPNYRVERFFLNVDDVTAIEWLKNTVQGRAWAESRNVDPDTINGTPPTAECGPDYPTPTATITSPTSGAVLSGRVEFYGSANVPNLDRFEIQYAPISTPNNFLPLPEQIYEDLPLPNAGSLLGLWRNSSELPDGQYYIRVEVFAQNGASLASDPILVTIANAPAIIPSSPSTDSSATPTTGEAIPGTENTGP